MKRHLAALLALTCFAVVALGNGCSTQPDICPAGQTWFLCDIQFSPPNQCGCQPYWKKALPFCGSDASEVGRQILMDMGLSQVSAVKCTDTKSGIMAQSIGGEAGGGAVAEQPSAGAGPDPSAGAGFTLDECAGACHQ